MIRKAIIVALTLTSLAFVSAWTWSLRGNEFRRDAYSSFFRVKDGAFHFSGISGTPTWPVGSSSIFGLEYDSWGWTTPTVSYVEFHDIRIPLWFPAILFATYPTIALIRGPLRRRRRRKRGLCVECGYNLTGLTDRRCPECSTGFTRAEASQNE